MPYYAVAKGRSAGVYNSWNACRENVNGYSGATYKKFDTQSEAQNFVSERGGGSSGYSSRSYPSASYSSGSNSGDYSSNRNSSSGSGGRGSYSRGGYSRGDSVSKVASAQASSGYVSSSSYGGGYGGGYSSVSNSSRASKPEKIYVDGAARGNGKNACPKSGYGVYYGPGDSRNSAVPLSNVDDVSQVKPTNQRAELHAMHHALRDIQQEQKANPSSSKSYEIHTDSTYTKKSIDTWADTWKGNDWKTSSGSKVANQDLIERTHGIYTDLKNQGVPVNLVHVKGHSGIEGNEQADRLANQGADLM